MMRTQYPRSINCRALSLVQIFLLVLLIIGLAVLFAGRFTSYSTRSKTSRVKSDMRSMATAIEAYFVDNGEYPAMAVGEEGANAFASNVNPAAGCLKICTFRLRNDSYLHTLTTPISYITEFFTDPFADTKRSYFGYRQFQQTWILISYGPDRDENTTAGDHYNQIPKVDLLPNGSDRNFEPTFHLTISQPSPEYLSTTQSRGSEQALIYDPTNGTYITRRRWKNGWRAERVMIPPEGDIVRIKQ